MTHTLTTLNLPPDARALIIHADDVGVSHASNLAAFECLEQGSITSASTLVPAPWFAETAALAKQQPTTDIGVHLTLTCEYDRYRWRSLTGHPSLHAPDGGMWRTVAEVVANISPDVARDELRAQVQLALDNGIDLTHVDGHMRTLFHPKYLPAYVGVAIEFRLPIFLARPSERRLAALGDAAPVYIEQTRRLDDAGIPLVDNAITETMVEVAPDDKERQFKDWFANLRPGLTHFLCHPAKPGDELDAMSPNDAPHRAAEYRLFRTKDIRDWCAAHNVILIAYRDLRERVR